jgi:hypothetical protein
VIDLTDLADNSLQIVNSLNEVQQFRVTGLVSFAQCPRRWAAEMLGAKLTDLKAREKAEKYSKIGTAAHHVIEGYLKADIDPEDETGWKEVDRFAMKAGCHLPSDSTSETICAYWHRGGVGSNTWRRTSGAPTSTPCRSRARSITSAGVNRISVGTSWTTRRIGNSKARRSGRSVSSRCCIPASCGVGRALKDTIPKPIRYTIGYVNLGSFVTWMTDPLEDATGLERYLQLFEEFLVYRRTGEFPARLNTYCSSCPIRDACPTARDSVNDLAALAGVMQVDEVSLFDRHDFLTNAAKLAEALLEEVRDNIRLRMTLDDAATWEDNGWTATLKTRQTRKADPLAVFNELRDCAIGLEEEAFRDCFTVKMGGIDRLVKTYPEIAPGLVGLITSEDAENPTLTIKKMKSRTLERVDT